MDQTKILSVGIDVGTTTTQVVFARLTLENTSGYFAVPHVSIVKKEIIYKSGIYFTPLLNAVLLDGEGIRKIVATEYGRAHFAPSDVGTGAVIVTGEAARKENAAVLLKSLSGFAGEFVVSTAGPDLESVLAGKASGAQRASEDRGITVINLDIGGGTTNAVFFDSGETAAKGCLDIGGRQIRVDDAGAITYISESAKKVAAAEGIPLAAGGPASVPEIQRLCARMARLFEEWLGLSPPTPLLEAVRTNESTPLLLPRKARAVCFSGGVADCILNSYDNPFCYGDIGPLLGKAIRESRLTKEFETIRASETIRATVVGAGSFSTSVSGSTISADAQLLPLKNVPVLKLQPEEQARCYRGDEAFLYEKTRWFLEQSGNEVFLLAMRGEPNPAYETLLRLAECISGALPKALPASSPLLLALESDTAKALGQLIGRILPNRPVVCIDSVRVEQGDYIDLGRPLMGGVVIPVVVKTIALG